MAAAPPPPPFEPGSLPVFREEGFADKFMRKTRENPLVPLGCLCTLGVLTYGLVSFKRGNVRRSQLMMRARILAQGFTFAALLGGMVATAMKSKK
ncbi:HIG1 domain family member 2A, mitochondrial [Colius striatus]|uniref:HIG1 domain family member 2A, mitochondrial n=1 Tax=Colius striatus TaxID=57412 RepID=UPI002B1D9A28|nr:HIG1 domain family member 2A, mitochondrial [Colius striatus]